MLQWLYTSLQRSVTNFSSLFPGRMLQVCLSRCCICFTQTLHVFYLDVTYGCNGFQVFPGVFSSVSKACFKCFICLQMYVATVVFECFKSRSGVASFLLAFCCIVLVCPPLGVGRASIRCCGWVLPNRRRRPLPLLSLGRHRLRVECGKWSGAHGRPDLGVRPNVRTLALPLKLS
jgi:hypothetical protein